MQPYQQRTIDEKLQLDERILKLEEFFRSYVFPSLSSDDQALLREQHHAMMQYSNILKQRIEMFNRLIPSQFDLAS